MMSNSCCASEGLLHLHSSLLLQPCDPGCLQPWWNICHGMNMHVVMPQGLLAACPPAEGGSRMRSCKHAAALCSVNLPLIKKKKKSLTKKSHISCCLMIKPLNSRDLLPVIASANPTSKHCPSPRLLFLVQSPLDA